jgi:hypothetical protein
MSASLIPVRTGDRRIRAVRRDVDRNRRVATTNKGTTHRNHAQGTASFRWRGNARAPQFPNDIGVSIAVPPAGEVATPALQYTFVTGDTSQPIAPMRVEWRDGNGINTG